MNKNIILIIIIVIIAIGVYSIFNINYTNIEIIGASIEVPESEFKVSLESDVYNSYIDEKHDIEIYGYDSTNENLTDLKDSAKFKLKKEAYNTISDTITKDDIILNKTPTGKYCYLYSNNDCHKEILIISSNPDFVSHAVKSLKIIKITQKPNSFQNIDINSFKNNITTTDNNFLTDSIKDNLAKV